MPKALPTRMTAALAAVLAGVRNLTIVRRLWLSFVLLLAVLGASGLLSVWMIRQITRNVIRVTEVHEPLEVAVLEMQIDAVRRASAAADYVRDPKQSTVDKAGDFRADWERHFKASAPLMHADAERQFGRLLIPLYGNLQDSSHEIMDKAAGRKLALQRFRKEAQKIDELIDGKPQKAIDHSGPHAPTEVEAALGMEVNIDESFAAVESYVLHADPVYRQKVLDAAADFTRFEAIYRETGLTADEHQWLTRIDEDFAKTLEAGNQLMVVTDDRPHLTA